MDSSPYKERLQAQVGSVEFLWNPKQHLKGSGASTSLKSIIFLLYPYGGEERTLFSLYEQRFGSTSGRIIRERFVV